MISTGRARGAYGPLGQYHNIAAVPINLAVYNSPAAMLQYNLIVVCVRQVCRIVWFLRALNEENVSADGKTRTNTACSVAACFTLKFRDALMRLNTNSIACRHTVTLRPRRRFDDLWLMQGRYFDVLLTLVFPRELRCTNLLGKFPPGFSGEKKTAPGPGML